MPNKKSSSRKNRRQFIRNSGLALGGLMIVPRHVLGGKGFTAPSDKLNIAGIGVGGRGQSVIEGAYNKGAENIVALCDVDSKRAAKTFGQYPKASRYEDFRVMLEKEEKNIDAVMVCTPDHTHAVAALPAMQMGKHVYVEKPLTHNIYEARKLTEAAEKYKVKTQMGNQGASGDGVRRLMEWMQAGVIGDVTRVHCWTNRPVWPQGLPTPEGKHTVPDHLNWDLWLGPAAERDYHPAYHPFSWRGWWPFGTGALGDMGCHIVDPPFRVLQLGYPESVEASVSQVYFENWNSAELKDSCPPACKIHFMFPARNGMPPVELVWYDGGIMPKRPAELKPDDPMGDSGGGCIFEGSRGKMMCSTYGRNPTLLPLSSMDYFKEPEATIARVPEGHQQNWVKAIKEDGGTTSAFDFAGPLTETILMGNLAIRSYNLRGDRSFPGRKLLLWDGPGMTITNFEPANQFVKRDYRKGWAI